MSRLELADGSCDVCIVGAGPIGIELAVELKRIGASYTHLEASQIAHTISWYAPGTHFFSSADRLSLAGVPFHLPQQTKPTREDYLNYMRSLVEQFDLKIDTGYSVTSVSRVDDLLAVHATHPTYGISTFLARKVILSIGDMHRPILAGIPGEELLHVSHYLHEPHEYFRRDVLVVGSGNSAVEAVIRLHRVGARVHYSFRRKHLDSERIKYWLLPELEHLARSKQIALYPESVIQLLEPGRATLRNADASVVQLPTDRVLLLIGYEQDSTLFDASGIELVGPQKMPRTTSETMETNVPGIFVIGTARAGTKQGKVREFIETSHAHVQKVMHHLYGVDTVARPADPTFLEN